MNIIKAGEGLGKLKFGMTRNEVEKLLGQPEEIENSTFTEDQGSPSESWHYDVLELSLNFDQIDDWRLVTLAVTAENYVFHGFTPIGMSKEELINALDKHGIDDREHEDLSSDEFPDQELLSSEASQMNFWFEEDALTEIQWGPLFIDEETIKWPELG